jgi:subtilisin family serine protease
MTEGPRLSVLDAELAALARQARGEIASRRVRNLKARAAGARSAGGPAGKEEAVRSLKIVVRSGQEESVGEWVRQAGGKVVSGGPRVLLAELPVRALPELEHQPGIRSAEMPRLLLPRLEECRGPATGLEPALERHGLTGEGVVVGIVDTGVDWSHADFRETDGGSRLELFAHARRDDKGSLSRYDVFERKDLDAALRGRRKLPQGDPDGHGTHCASIAAGNGNGSDGRFCGVAPRAALMAVRSEPLLDDHTIWAIREIFRRAGDRPAVISLSLGHHYGAHDGTASLENVIAEESGPGHIVVVAAGNEGSEGIHWHGELVEKADLVIPFRIADGDWQFVDLWIPRGDEVEVLIETPDGLQTVPEGVPVETAFGIFTATWRQDRMNLDSNLTVIVEQGRVNHVWNLRLRPRVVLHGEVHAWGGASTPSTSAHLFPGAVDRRYSVGIPATEERAISVSSWVCRNVYEGAGGEVRTAGLDVGQLSPFSSEGPTRHGLLKPDIAAPGQYITGALAKASRMEREPQFRQRHHPSAPCITLQGTSMATPFVAGVVALMLQREPTLTPEEIQQRLRITARRDQHTRRVWGSGFGYGKIDVEKLLGYDAED